MTAVPSTVYPPQYTEIVAWVRGLAETDKPYVTHSRLQRKFNLTYSRSRIIIVLLLDDGVIRGYWGGESDANGRFEVVR